MQVRVDAPLHGFPARFASASTPWPPSFCWCCASAVEGSCPIPGTGDRFEHTAAWFVLTLTGYVLAPNRRLAIPAFALAYGALIEVLQGAAGTGRHSDPADFVADSAWRRPGGGRVPAGPAVRPAMSPRHAPWEESGEFRIGLRPISVEAWFEGGEADPAARKDPLFAAAMPPAVWAETAARGPRRPNCSAWCRKRSAGQSPEMGGPRYWPPRARGR